MAALRSVVAVSPPLDLSASADKIDGLGLVQRRFLDELHTHTQALHRHFPDTSPPPARATSLRGFDDAYTAPRSGYRDASDYYARASSGPRLAEIRVPTKLICAQDDPVIDTSALTGVPSHAALHVRVTQHGGHVGFVGRSRNVFGRWWVDERICAWIAARERDGFDPNTEREAP